MRDISAQIEVVEAEVAQREEAVTTASERMQEANKEFSNLMAAMSAAFREYDQAVTSNRELTSETEKTASALSTLRERSQQDLIAMREVRDKLTASNEENRATAEADRKLAVALTETIHETQKTVDDMILELETRRETIATSRRRLEEGCARKRAQDEKRAERMRAAKEAFAVAQQKSLHVRGQLEQRQVWST